MDVINGLETTITSLRELVVSTDEGSTKVLFQSLLITVGSETAVPDITGIHCAGVMSSDDALDLKEIPSSLVIIGAGVIGLEFADLFNGLGTKVTVLELEDGILPGEDKDIREELLKLLKRRGIAFKFGAQVDEIRNTAGALEVVTNEKGQEVQYIAKKVLVAVGRKLPYPLIDIPVILVGGIRSFQVAEKLVESQTADYISLSRPLIREPELINRWKSGNMSRALCLSDNICLQTCLNGNGVYCAVAAKEKEAGSLNP